MTQWRHSENFVDPETGTHTHAIESYWGKTKLNFKRLKGVQTSQLPGYLDERNSKNVAWPIRTNNWGGIQKHSLPHKQQYPVHISVFIKCISIVLCVYKGVCTQILSVLLNMCAWRKQKFIISIVHFLKWVKSRLHNNISLFSIQASKIKWPSYPNPIIIFLPNHSTAE